MKEKIVLIVSGVLGEEIIPRIHNLSQLSACYIFCSNTKRHKQWSNHYSKVKGVFNDINEFIRKYSEDQNDRNKYEENASISVISQKCESLEERNTIHMWFQLYIEVLLRMHHKLIDRKGLYELCKDVCQGNKYQLDIINEFEKNL